MNRNGDRPYPGQRLRDRLNALAARLDIRDAAGRLADFNRTRRFRHTKGTTLLNAGVPLHVVQRYLGHISPTMTMHYAQTLAETAEAEFLRYRKITADARDLSLAPGDLYDMLQLDKRTGRILPNGYCLLPPRQSCDRGNACLTCDKFATDVTFLPELRAQEERTLQLIDDRRAALTQRTGTAMSPANIWLAGRNREVAALDAIITALDDTPDTAGAVKTVRGAGVTARTEAQSAAWTAANPRATAMAGNLANLQKATAARTAGAVARAQATLDAMTRNGEPVTFRGVAARAGVSLDFLYRNTQVRSRIEHLRTTQQASAPGRQPAKPAPDEPGSVIRALTAQLADLRRRHREQTARLRHALEQSQGENLLLRRKLAAAERHRQGPASPPRPAT